MTSKILRIKLAFAALLLTATFAAGQSRTTSEPPAPQTEANPQEARTTADETFDLNITERRITRRDFEASTEVEAGEESVRGLSLRVGVQLGASSIDVLLKNVRGQVRFRASLERVLEQINSRRSANPSP